MPETYASTAEEVVAALGSNAAHGLASAEAARRLEQYGPNELKEAPREPLWKRLLAQFTSLIVLVLIGAAVVSALMAIFQANGNAEGWTDTIAIIAIVLINGILGFIQEERAEKSLAALKKLAAPKARVIRDGQAQMMESRLVVPGDIVEIETGDFVPADIRIVHQMNLQLDEAPLTGESTPVEKKHDIVLAPKTALGDRRNMAFMGTIATYGRGAGVVIGTGMNTEVGKIAGLLQAVSAPPTPLQERLEAVGKILVWATGIICVVIFTLDIARGPFTTKNISEMFMTAVSLAVAAIPEGLPAVVTIALALGVQRMVRRHVLIRKLPSVETLGCVSVICTDKTGTLTQNVMTVRKLYVDGRTLEVTGASGLQGEVTDGGERAARTPTLERMLTAGAVCNNAKLAVSDETKTVKAVGDPTESALLVVAAKGGVDWAKAAETYERIGEIPFDSERKAMSVIVRDREGRPFLFTKGAPDVVARMCAGIEIDGEAEPMDDARRSEILKANQDFASGALRVLAAAYKELSEDDTEPEENNLMFLGLFAMMDPPRLEVRDAIAQCRNAGIRTVMVTGDHKNTAIAVAKELGLWSEGDEVVSGVEIDEMSDDDLFRRVEKIRIFARVSAEHKMRVVKAWRRKGQVVAVTGDGVNDAPAIKEADIGIAMGITGTDVTKEASDMVLTDDNFASIVAAVEEGRSIYANIKKFIHFLLSCNIGEVLTMFIASLVPGMPVPLRAAQLLWINLVTDGFPALALGVDPAEKDVMKHKPRRSDERVIPGSEFGIMSIQGLVVALAALAAFHIGWSQEGFPKDECPLAQTMAFTTLVITQLFHSFDCRSFRRSVFTKGFLSNPALIVAFVGSFVLQMLVVYVTPLGHFFRIVPLLDARDMAIVIALSLSPVLATEIIKLFLRRRDKGVQD
jgi:Ca2+-transporting ATPase